MPLQLLVASDIFGRTAAFETLVRQLTPSAQPPVMVDPYGGALRRFESEAAAYAYFQRHVGLDRYIERVQSTIENATPPLVLVGFSVGAAAIWALSGSAVLPSATYAICFYGSQIRHYAAVVPRIDIDIDLFFPRSEPHFDVTALMARLSSPPRIVCHRTPYLHGFMNRLSENFDQRAYERYHSLLAEKIGRLSQR